MAIKIKTCAKVRRSPNYQAEETFYSSCRENLQFSKLITEWAGERENLLVWRGRTRQIVFIWELIVDFIEGCRCHISGRDWGLIKWASFHILFMLIKTIKKRNEKQNINRNNNLWQTNILCITCLVCLATSGPATCPCQFREKFHMNYAAGRTFNSLQN